MLGELELGLVLEEVLSMAGPRELFIVFCFAPALGELAFGERDLSGVPGTQLEMMCACVYMRVQQEWRMMLGGVHTFRPAGEGRAL